MIVVDMDVVAYLWIPGKHTPKAERAFEKDPQWAAPMLWRFEFSRILRYYVLKGKMTLETARKISHEAEKIIRDREYVVPASVSMDLSVKHPLTTYESEALMLARRLNTMFLTMNKSILRDFPDISCSLNEFTSNAVAVPLGGEEEVK